MERWIIVLQTCACACIDTLGFSSRSGFPAIPWGEDIITTLASGSTFVLSKELYFMQAKKDKRRETPRTEWEREYRNEKGDEWRGKVRKRILKVRERLIELKGTVYCSILMILKWRYF